jgi:4-hydroxy-tetrahydrodipicolinate synthase
MKQRITGVLSPVLTPFDADLKPDKQNFLRHCRWLVKSDVGLAPFGTNSEAASLSIDEKMELLDALAESDIPMSRVMAGTGACSLTDTVKMTRHAVDRACAGVLMLPPFYFKNVSDDGLFAYFSEAIERVGSSHLRVYLYHIPPVSQVPISLQLIERLLARYPDTIAGIKDSSGDWSNTQAMLSRFQPRGFDVFAGSESFLLATLRAGGAGCITATANVNPLAIARLVREWKTADADAQQGSLNATRAVFQKYGMIPAMKSAISQAWNVPSLAAPRPPLTAISPTHATALASDLRDIGFAISG